MSGRSVEQLVAGLAERGAARTEAMVQADVRELLLAAPLGLDERQVVTLEAQVGDRRRIDVEVGFTAIEVKKDIRKGRVRADAEQQLAGYVEQRTRELGERYVGVITDGAEWRGYQLRDGALAEVSSITVSAKRPDVDALLVWLEGVLATAEGLPPTPEEVRRRLGATSSSYALDRATLSDLYARAGDRASVKLKRQLWAKLLTTALGTQFEDRDDLFVEHTLLVNSAEVIAHALLGFDVATLPPSSMLSGQQFEQAGVSGVVENHFFDWVLEIPEGEAFVRALARRLSRFDWGAVDHDVLKVLYESVIGADTRRRLGEYYTPDWLAGHMVATVVDAPLRQRVLDPACGSGTFLFHAVRRYLDEAEQAGVPLAESLGRLSSQVIGLDLHPVAVALARVTYLLAIGPQRLTDARREHVTVPVYLGDSLQWQQRLDLWSAEHLVVPTSDEGELFAAQLRFPDHLLADVARFDQLVEVLSALAGEPRLPGEVPSLSAVFRQLAVDERDQSAIQETFAVLCRLHDEGRDHIWSFYVRNLARPAWLTQMDNRVDVLVGNPPWLAYRHMPASMQERFRELSEARGLWAGATVATHQDLSALFVARTIQLYLRLHGRFAFVMPNAALDRDQFVGFRRAEYADPAESVAVAFDQPWDLRRLRPHFFPRASAVVFGTRTTVEGRQPMPESAERWTGRLPASYRTRVEVDEVVARETGPLTWIDREAGLASAYHDRFANGATVVPRKLFVVEERPSGPLGLPAGRTAVRSVRSAYEKPPWKDLEPLEGVVEREFVRPLYVGATVLPFRLLPPQRAIIPLERRRYLPEDPDRFRLYRGLQQWWRAAEGLWDTHRSSDRLSLAEQLDYRRKLTDQVPAIDRRVVYTASGMHISAAQVRDAWGIVEHSLYWAAVPDADEAHYLCAILNSPKTTALVRPLMSYGKDERHVDKYVWRLPIPKYNADSERHRRLAELGCEAEAAVADLELDDSLHFASLRRHVRRHLAESPIGMEIDELVMELLG